MTIGADPAQIAAGATAVLDVTVSQNGHPVAGLTVRLLERKRPRSGWKPAGTATTGADGKAAVDVADLTRNASFRFAGPHHAVSAVVAVTVVPAVSLRLVPHPRINRDVLIVRSPLAQPGNLVVLQVQSGSGWVDVRARRLGLRRQAVFAVRAHRFSGQELRVLLSATARHAASASGPVTAP